MEVNNCSPNVNFQMRFWHTESLHNLCMYAVETGQMGMLYNAKVKLGKHHLPTRFKFDFFEQNGETGVRFTRFFPKRGVRIAQNGDDYRITNIYENLVPADANPFQYACNIFLEMAEGAPKGDKFQEIVVAKSKEFEKGKKKLPLSRQH